MRVRIHKLDDTGFRNPVGIFTLEKNGIVSSKIKRSIDIPDPIIGQRTYTLKDGNLFLKALLRVFTRGTVFGSEDVTKFELTDDQLLLPLFVKLGFKLEPLDLVGIDKNSGIGIIPDEDGDIIFSKGNSGEDLAKFVKGINKATRNS